LRAENLPGRPHAKVIVLRAARPDPETWLPALPGGTLDATSQSILRTAWDLVTCCSTKWPGMTESGKEIQELESGVHSFRRELLLSAAGRRFLPSVQFAPQPFQADSVCWSSGFL